MRNKLTLCHSFSAFLRSFVRPCIVLAAMLFSGWLQFAHAAQVTVRWDYQATGAAGFMLYCGPTSGTYPTRIDVGNTDTYTIGTLPEGATSRCAVTAYDSSRVESDHSNELAVNVPYAAPTASFSASPASGAAPLNVAFSNSATGQVTSWSWNFGDGTSSTAANPSHVYSTPGTYTATLTATGPGGSTSKATTISVSAAPTAPVVSFTASPASGTAPLSVAFSNTTSGEVTTWSWNFGDGTTSNAKNPTHVYSTPGSYTATLTATGPGGTASKTSTTPIVANQGGTVDQTPPTVTIASPAAGATVSGTATITANAADNVGVVGVQFLLDGIAVGAEQTGPSFSLSWNTTGVANGVHSISARARDAAGNIASATTVSVTVSNAKPSGPVASYTFNAGSGTTVSDASGNGNVGTINGATWSTQGRYGAALKFDGIDDVIQVPASASLNVSSAMTLEAWISPTASQTGWRTIIEKEPSSYFLHASSSYGPMRPAGGGRFSGVVYHFAGPGANPVNAWTHLALTYDGAAFRLYVNGVLAASQARTGVIQTNGSPLRIGGNGPYGEYFQGLIDEVRIYNRALSQAEIQSDMKTPVADIAAPSAPTALKATPVGTSRIDLTWTAAKDNIGVSGYRVERCQGMGCTNFNQQFATGAGTSFSNTGLAAGTSYTYRMRATDAAGNLSAYSTTVSAKTP